MSDKPEPNWFMDAINRELPRFEAELIELGQPGVDLVFRRIARDLARDMDDEEPPRRPAPAGRFA